MAKVKTANRIKGKYKYSTNQLFNASRYFADGG